MYKKHFLDLSKYLFIFTKIINFEKNFFNTVFINFKKSLCQSISGFISDSAGEKIPFTNVYLKNTKIGMVFW